MPSELVTPAWEGGGEGWRGGGFYLGPSLSCCARQGSNPRPFACESGALHREGEVWITDNYTGRPEVG